MVKSKKIKSRYKRILALLLCIVLSVEGASLTALAVEPVTESISENSSKVPSVNMEEAEKPEGNGSADEGQNPMPSEAPGEVDLDHSGEEENTDKEIDIPADGETGQSVGEAGDKPVEGADSKWEEPQESVESEEVQEEEQETVSENTLDAVFESASKTVLENVLNTVSENTLETVSENTLETISEDDMDAEWQQMVKEAVQAFEILLSQKPLMALLYRTDSYDVRSEADEDSGAVATLDIGQTLYIEGVEITEDGVWYLVRYVRNGTEGTGYVESYYLAYSDEEWIAWWDEYLQPYSVMTYAGDTSDIRAFPGSYQSALEKLKNLHPNWIFVPMKTGLDFQTAVSKEMGDKSLIEKTSSNSSKGWVGVACPTEGGWYYATKPAVSYYMDPRNFLTENYIFQFEQLTFNASYHTESAVQTFLNGTFMKGTLPDDSKGRTYAKAFYEIGSGRKLSPIHLASRVYQEQGKGTSGLISGKYPGYEGYYNFFNVGVNGGTENEKIVKGLTYAKGKGWNTRYKSLEGGAATIGNNYILKYQDTIYLEKFNVDKNSPYGIYNHQYMQNIVAPASESSSTKKMYANAGSLNSAFVFKIPVYDNMPDEGGSTEEPEVPEEPVQTTCTLVFHGQDAENDTSVIEKRILNCGDKVGPLPKAQQLKGKIFRGWYNRANGKGSRIMADTPVYAEMTHVYPYYQVISGGFYVVPVGDQTYTGSAIKPQLQVFDGMVTEGGIPAGEEELEVLALVEGKDYTVSYKNNKNVNAEDAARPTIIVKGKGNYAGTQEVYFDIRPKNLSDRDITRQNITVAYSGKVIKSTPVLYRGGKKLAVNKDYTVSYPQTGEGAYSKIGAYPVEITGKGGYTGKVTVYEIITSSVLFSKVSVAKIPNQTYTSEKIAKDGGIKPAALQVTYKNKTLTEGVDYTVAYSGNKSIGKATATLTAVRGSGYAGSKSVTYQIVGTSIAKAKVSGLTDKEYVEIDKKLDIEGAAYEKEYQKVLQTPGAYSLAIDGQILTESKDGVAGDYVVSYAGAAKKGAVKAGTATIVFKGINAYSGQLKKTYKILSGELSADRVGSGRDFTLSYYTQDAPESVKPLTDLNEITAPYVKGGSEPVILLRFCGKQLIQGKDYTISYKNNNALTTVDTDSRKLPSFTIKGKGNFKGTIKGNFTVTDGRFDKQIGDGSNSKRKVTMTLKDMVYREKKGAYKTKAVLRDVNGAVLKAGRDYDKNLQYTYEAETEVLVSEAGDLIPVKRNAGEAVGEEDIPQIGASIRVTARGIGAYAGEGKTPPVIYAAYRIVLNDFSKVKVKAAAKSYQNGKAVKLTAEDLTVTVSGTANPLKYGVDYVIEEESYVNHTKKGKAKVTLKGIGNYGGEKTITYTIGAKTLWW